MPDRLRCSAPFVLGLSGLAVATPNAPQRSLRTFGHLPVPNTASRKPGGCNNAHLQTFGVGVRRIDDQRRSGADPGRELLFCRASHGVLPCSCCCACPNGLRYRRIQRARSALAPGFSEAVGITENLWA